MMASDHVELSSPPTASPDIELRQFVIPGARAKGKTLGRGAYGTVEEYDVDGVPCAGKRMYDVLVQSGERDVVRRYVEECKMLEKLRHPNVVQFLGVCFPPESALPVLIMERLTTDLHGLLENTPNIPLSLRMSFLTDVARGLAYLHSHRPSIIHRDLSARNILLNSSLVTKISDLGNSRMVNLSPAEVAELSFVPGALVYMPPEISEGSSRYGPSLDIFSFGHLGLFTATQVFPCDLLQHNYRDPIYQRRLIGRSEVERRERYFTQLCQQLGEEHGLVRVIVECLDNDPHQRPTAELLVPRLEEMSVEVQSPQDHTAKLQLMGQLRQIEDSEWRQELHSVNSNREQLQEGITRLMEDKETIQSQLTAEVEEVERRVDILQSQLRAKGREMEEREREFDTLSAERRMLQYQLREREDSIEQLHQELRDAQQAKNHSLLDPVTAVMSNIRQYPDIPIAICDAQAVVIRGKVYVGGGLGVSHRVYIYSIFIFDIRGKSWSSIESSTFGSALASYKENLVLAGGAIPGQGSSIKITDQLWVLGDNNCWQQPIPPMQTPRGGASVVGYGQYLVVAGGASTTNKLFILDTVEVYSGQQWMVADAMPCGYFGMKSTVLNGTWYLTGGGHSIGNSVPTNGDTSVLTVSLQSLTERATSPQRRGLSSLWNKLTDAPKKLMAIASTGGGLLAFGGYDMFSHRSHAYMYVPPTMSWVSIGELPHYLYSTCAVTLPSGEVMLCGGRNVLNTSMVYVVQV